MSARQERSWFAVIIISLLAFIIFSILLLHSFILIHNVQKRLLMTRKIINNESNYTLFISMMNASQMLPDNHLNVLNNLSNYKLQVNGYDINFSVSDHPEWPIQLTGEVSAQEINQFVKKNHYQIKVSYLLKNGRWLNYSETPHVTTYNLTVILFLAEAVLVGTLAFYGWSVYRLKVPLENLKASAERLGIDFKVSPVKETGPILVRDAAKAMNLMQERIQELIQNRTQLLAAISHDLRTPITRLKLRAQFLNNEEHAQKISDDLEEMQNMISGVLSFARNDVFHEIKTKFDLISLLLTICNDFIDLGNSIHVTCDINACDIHGRRIALKRCISNVIHNATKFGKQLNVKIKQTYPQIIVIVEDDGPGIPVEELPLVYKPFYRAKSSMQKPGSGTGLGLTVAYEVVKDHHGDIRLENIEPHGLRVVITLPVLKSS